MAHLERHGPIRRVPLCRHGLRPWTDRLDSSCPAPYEKNAGCGTISDHHGPTWQAPDSLLK